MLHPHLGGNRIDRLQSIGGGFIRAKHPHRIGVEFDQIPDQLRQGHRVLRLDGPRRRHGHGVVLEGWKAQIAAQQASIGMGIGAHAQAALGRMLPQLWQQAAVGVEQLFWAIAAQPFLQHLQLLGITVRRRQGQLVATPKPF